MAAKGYVTTTAAMIVKGDRVRIGDVRGTVVTEPKRQEFGGGLVLVSFTVGDKGKDGEGSSVVLSQSDELEVRRDAGASRVQADLDRTFGLV